MMADNTNNISNDTLLDITKMFDGVYQYDKDGNLVKVSSTTTNSKS